MYKFIYVPSWHWTNLPIYYQVFYGVLLQYFSVTANTKPLNYKLLNMFVEPLMKMSTEIPYFAAICARQRLHKTRTQFVEDMKESGWSNWYWEIFLDFLNAGPFLCLTSCVICCIMSFYRDTLLAFFEDFISFEALVYDISMLWFLACSYDSSNIVNVWIFNALPNCFWSGYGNWILFVLDGSVCKCTLASFMFATPSSRHVISN